MPAAMHDDSDDGDAELSVDDLLAASRTGLDVGARERRRRLRDAVLEGATLRGTLLDLAEQRTPVVLITAWDRRHAGRLDALGSDFARLVLDDGRLLFVTLDAIAGIVPQGHGGAVAGGERGAPTDLSLAELLRMRTADRPELLVWRGMAATVSGELRSVGVDIATLVTATGVEHVALGTITEVATHDVR